jgi:hypothetical protein
MSFEESLEYQEFDTQPTEEEAVQVGWPHYFQAQGLEAKVMANYLDRVMRAQGVNNLRITVATVQHDFGPYQELRVYGSDEVLAKVEASIPDNWDVDAKNLLDTLFIRTFHCAYKTFIRTKGECVDARVSKDETA